MAEEVVMRMKLQVFMDTTDLDSSEGKHTGKSPRSLASLTDLEVTFPNRTVPECFLCKKKANMKSPLKSGGYHPWYGYKRVINTKTKETTATVPKGSICMICRSVYKTIGYGRKYGVKENFAKYKEEMAKPTGTQFHKTFLTAQSEWIELYNRDGGANSSKHRLSRLKVQVQANHRRREMAKTTELSVHERETEFVENKLNKFCKDMKTKFWRRSWDLTCDVCEVQQPVEHYTDSRWRNRHTQRIFCDKCAASNRGQPCDVCGEQRSARIRRGTKMQRYVCRECQLARKLRPAARKVNQPKRSKRMCIAIGCPRHAQYGWCHGYCKTCALKNGRSRPVKVGKTKEKEAYERRAQDVQEKAVVKKEVLKVKKDPTEVPKMMANEKLALFGL